MATRAREGVGGHRSYQKRQDGAVKSWSWSKGVGALWRARNSMPEWLLRRWRPDEFGLLAAAERKEHEMVRRTRTRERLSCRPNTGGGGAGAYQD